MVLASLATKFLFARLASLATKFVCETRKKRVLLFLKFTQHFSSREACLPSPCLFQICLALSVQGHHRMDAILSLLPAGQISLPCLTSAFAYPHPAMSLLSYSH
jgi:hypothetical protein